ncbi:hypothetical protein F4779DRAFT_9832 [Xylariaceae sp. FL0662B]|nr:hypothetical protein F4779DRAFT_9832 [Xylariaceae sp. FL0662B]
MGYYLPTLLIESVGVSSPLARAAIICLLISRVGRRKFMLYGSIATGSCYLATTVTLKEATLHPENKAALESATVAP